MSVAIPGLINLRQCRPIIVY